jgi:predicted enzyme related to lactoylglutathione lyase
MPASPTEIELQMMDDETTRKQGAPNWADCAAADLDASERFSATFFGWIAERVTASDGAVYSIQRLGGEMVAGIHELCQEMRSMKAPPHCGA